MIPFERDLYVTMVVKWISDKEKESGGDQPGGLYNMDGTYVNPLGNITAGRPDGS